VVVVEAQYLNVFVYK